MPKCSAAASTTWRAAPTTSGPMPSPGRSSTSKDFLITAPPETPASTPATPFRPDPEPLLVAPRPAPHRLSRLLPTMCGRCVAENPLQTHRAPPRRARATGSGTTSDPPSPPALENPARQSPGLDLSAKDAHLKGDRYC